MVVTAVFESPELHFRIPYGVDVEDKTQVTNWWVRYATLHIEYCDGRKEEIESIYSLDNSCDWKNPVDTSIEDAGDAGIDFDELDEELEQ
jgi:hypothetical protein